MRITDFKNKTSLQTYLKTMLNNYSAGDVIKSNDKHFQLLLEIASNHPNPSKFKGTLRWFSINRCEHNWRNQNVAWVNTHGDAEVFSVYKAVLHIPTKNFTGKVAKRKEQPKIEVADYPNWTVDFGKYKGKIISTLTSAEDFRYVRWFVETREKDYSVEENAEYPRYQVLKWWLVKNEEPTEPECHPLMRFYHYQLN